MSHGLPCIAPEEDRKVAMLCFEKIIIWFVTESVGSKRYDDGAKYDGYEQ